MCDDDDGTPLAVEAAEADDGIDVDDDDDEDEDDLVGLVEAPAKRAASGDGENRPVGSMCCGARIGVGMPWPT